MLHTPIFAFVLNGRIIHEIYKLDKLVLETFYLLRHGYGVQQGIVYGNRISGGRVSECHLRRFESRSGGSGVGHRLVNFGGERVRYRAWDDVKFTEIRITVCTK